MNYLKGSLDKKRNFSLRISTVNADLITITEEILSKKLCAEDVV